MIAAFVLASAVVVSAPGVAADAQVDALRNRYQEAGEEGRVAAGFAYGEALLKRWATASPESDEAPALRKELKTLQEELQGAPLTEKASKAKTAWAVAAFPLLLEGKLDRAKAKTLAQIVEPTRAQRMTDALAEKGEPAEPYGWDVQAVHALALARAGQVDAARKESDLVLKKVEIALTQSRQFPTEFLGSVRSLAAVRREALLQRALVEAIAGDDAAVVARTSAAGPPEEQDPAATAAEQKLIHAIADALEAKQASE
ncbi:MAG TPA: hypothetical protein VGN57_16825 [Pirellulaceae bacterium]|nr:hypothetical protein [Pirellulaceae bacterium]